VQFSDLALSPAIQKAVANEGYTVATPIQAQAIPHILEGRDVLGCAQTGTGKTAAFALPLLDVLSRKDHAQHGRRARCLVLSPTRELALQITDSFHAYGKGLQLKHTSIFGGVSQGKQVDALKRGLDIIVATPGRLMDLMQQGYVNLDSIKMLVLDEADRMLDMGFIQPIRKIVAKIPQGRQTLLFSATMPPEIRSLADSLLDNPAVVQVTPVSSTAAKIDEAVYKVDKGSKPALLAHLVKELPMYRTIVFTRTKHGADKVVKQLHNAQIRAEAIHGNKSQSQRQRALTNFANNKIPVLVATDIASRGIDVDGITHVVNYDLTHEPETYVHRIGRTGRAGASGMAISFCDREEHPNLRAIERLVKRLIPRVPNPLTGEVYEMPREQPGENREGGNSQNPQQRRHGGPSGVHQKPQRKQFQPQKPGGYRQDRPQSQRPQGQRPQGERPQGQRPQGERPQQDRSQQQRDPQQPRPQHHTPAAVAPRAVHPLRSKNQPQGNGGARPQHGGQPQGRPQGGHPQHGNRRPQQNRGQGRFGGR